MKFQKITLSLLIISLLIPKITFSQNWKPLTASVTFKIKHVAGATAEGSFKGFVGNIVFDPMNLATAALKGTIDTRTFETGSSMRDKTVKGEDYFDVEKYPKITMSSTKIEKGAEPNAYVGSFDLTIKNVTKNIKMPFTFIQKENQGQFQGSFKINRLEYGVGGKSFILNDFPTIAIMITAQK